MFHYGKLTCVYNDQEPPSWNFVFSYWGNILQSYILQVVSHTVLQLWFGCCGHELGPDCHWLPSHLLWPLFFPRAPWTLLHHWRLLSMIIKPLQLDSIDFNDGLSCELILLETCETLRESKSVNVARRRNSRYLILHGIALRDAPHQDRQMRFRVCRLRATILKLKKKRRASSAHVLQMIPDVAES